MAEGDQFPAVFFRWVEDAELADFRSEGRLRPCEMSSYDGKYATTTVEFALGWAARFGGGGGVLRIEVLEYVPDGAYYIDSNLDSIGPGWFLSFEQLARCEITEGDHD